MKKWVWKNKKPTEVRWEKFITRAPSGCWLWTGGLHHSGYGAFSFNGKTRLAHRVLYEHYIGPVPKGLQLDHLCRVRHCVNPNHVEPVTCRINLLRGEGFSAKNAALTHCRKGHVFDELNTYHPVKAPNGRRCRKCNAEDKRKSREARAA